MSVLGNSKAEYFDSTEDGFHNLLSHKMGTSKADLRHVIRDRVVPEVFIDVAMEWMYQIRFTQRRLVRTTGQFSGCSKSI